MHKNDTPIGLKHRYELLSLEKYFFNLSCSSCRVHLLQLRTLHALIHRIRFCPNHWTPVPLEKGLSKI